MLEMRVWSLGREDPLEKGIGNQLQYSCLENPIDRGACWSPVHRVTNSQIWRSMHPKQKQYCHKFNKACPQSIKLVHIKKKKEKRKTRTNFWPMQYLHFIQILTCHWELNREGKFWGKSSTKYQYWWLTLVMLWLVSMLFVPLSPPYTLRS